MNKRTGIDGAIGVYHESFILDEIEEYNDAYMEYATMRAFINHWELWISRGVIYTNTLDGRKERR